MSSFTVIEPIPTGNLRVRSLQCLLSVALLLPMLAAAEAPAGWRPLLEPAELATIFNDTPDIRILRVTGNYDRGHLPGSIESPYEAWRGAGRNPGQLRDLSEYGSLLRSLGINDETPVVVVHQGDNPADMGAATRVYWTLKSLGVSDVAVINGGYLAWEEQYPVSTKRVTVAPSDYQPVWHENWRVTTAEVEELVQSGDANLIDARPLSFYRGLRATLGKPGTIRGAGNLEYTSWFEGDRLRDSNALASVMADYGAAASPVTVSFCNTGHWASINWFVMSELLSLENTRLYAESVAAWSETERPMDNQAGRLEIYRDLTARWLRDLFGN